MGHLVSNGIPNIQSIVVVPLISQASSNGTGGTIRTLLSPCCNSGTSPDPLQKTNLQYQGKICLWIRFPAVYRGITLYQPIKW